MRKQTNTLSSSPKGFQSPKFSDSDFREVRGLGLGRTKSSGKRCPKDLQVTLKPTLSSLSTGLVMVGLAKDRHL
jgi:hypothetical protein